METQPQGPFSQSCSMPLQNAGDCGTNRGAAMSKLYCNYCYRKGKFTKPDITLGRMIEEEAG